MLSNVNQTKHSKMVEIVEQYISSLQELVDNCKPRINMLTMLAKDDIEYAPAIVEAVEANLQKRKNYSQQLPVLYLIDSIVKNLRGIYLNLFSRNIANTFCHVFGTGDKSTRIKLFELRQTWNNIFSVEKLFNLDSRVKSIDPNWPIQQKPENPQKVSNEQKLREELLKKQKELAELQKKKLELEKCAFKIIADDKNVTKTIPTHVPYSIPKSKNRQAMVAKETPNGSNSGISRSNNNNTCGLSAINNNGRVYERNSNRNIEIVMNQTAERLNQDMRPDQTRWQQPWHQPWARAPFQGPCRSKFQANRPWQNRPRFIGSPMRPDYHQFHGGLNPRLPHPPVGPNGPNMMPNGPNMMPNGPINYMSRSQMNQMSGPMGSIGPNMMMGSGGPMMRPQRLPRNTSENCVTKSNSSWSYHSTSFNNGGDEKMSVELSYQAEPGENLLATASPIKLPVNIYELYQRLVETGLVSSDFNETKKPEEKEKKEPEIIKASFDNLKTLTMKPALITHFYSGNQCHFCGMRFKPEMKTQHGQHLDWHFRENRKKRNASRKLQYERPHVDLCDWIQLVEGNEDLDDRVPSLFETEEQNVATKLLTETLQPSVPSGSKEDSYCHVCRETFREFFDDEEEEWRLTPAVCFENQNFHPICLEDHKKAIKRELSEAMEIS